MKKNQQKLILPALILGIVVVFLLMSTLVRIFGEDDVWFDLSNAVTADLVDANGEETDGVSGQNVILSPGDTLVYHIEIPQSVSLSDPVLCFSDYNCTVHVVYNHRTLYVYDDDSQAHPFIGDLLVRVRLPEETMGETVTVTIRHAQRIPANHNVTFGLMSASKAWRYPIIGHETEFVIYFAMLAVSIILLVFLAMIGITRPHVFRACLLVLFTALVCTWYLGYNRFFYVLTDITKFNAHIEYYALAFAPLPLLSYIVSINRKGIYRTIYWILLIADAVIGTFASVVTGLPADISFNDTLQLLQFVLLLFALTLLSQMILVLIKKIKVTRDNRIFLLGFTSATLMAALQVLSFWIRDINGAIPEWLRDFLELDFASIGIMVFVITLVYSYTTRSVDELVRQAQQDELKKLAYVDLLSGIHNRSWCVRQMEEMRENGQKEFTVVFMDADGLKHANDVYGHETGDLLIRTVAEGIRECFKESRGFYGRWGGDEFVAFFYEGNEAEAFAERFQKFQSDVNERKTFPFSFSVSVGLCESSEVSTENGQSASANPTIVINEADRRMYERKKAAKRARS